MARTLVYGIGATGLSCARYLYERGVEFQIVDSREQPPELNALREAVPGVQPLLGDLDQVVLDGVDRLVASPGIPLADDLLTRAGSRGIAISGDLDLFVEAVDQPIAAVTGSNAKSTVVALLEVMAANENVSIAAGGNIGTPMLDLVDSANRGYVLELSSFQLERSNSLQAEVACILNVSPDHIDQHGTVENYVAAKHKVYDGARTIVFNRADAATRPEKNPASATISFGLDGAGDDDWGVVEEAGEKFLVRGSEKIIARSKLPMTGTHNVENVLAALAIGTAFGFSQAGMLDAVRGFTGLPHRCERVAVINDVLYINDSKATNVGACLAAVAGIEVPAGSKITLLLGGVAKNADFSGLAATLSATPHRAITYGVDGDQIYRALAPTVEVSRAASLEEAVVLASESSAPGDCVLLSPACASFDSFENFGARGEFFRELVGQIGARASAFDWLLGLQCDASFDSGEGE